MKNPLVSVTIITFNQENFIKQTLDSVLSQKVNFHFEIIISDDASTDNTQSIIKEYAQNFPDIIKPIYRTVNIGHTANYIETTKKCSGKYIAHLDGDDLMLPSKLQKQVDFLESHPEYSLVHHLVKLINDKGNIIGKTKIKKATKGDINKLLVRNNIINSSNMFLKSSLDEHFYSMPTELMLHDWLAHIIKAQYGKIGFIPEFLGCYRVYSTSIIKSASKHKLTKAELYTLNYARNLKNVNIKYIEKGMNTIYLSRANHSMKSNNFIRAKYYLHQAKKHISVSTTLCRLSIKLFFKKFSR